MSFRSLRYKTFRWPRYAWRYLVHPANRRTLLLWGATLPAILVLCSAFWLVAVAAGSDAYAHNWYSQRASAALASGDAATARLCYASLLQRQPDNPSYQFGLAISLMGIGDEEGGAAIMHRLAPLDKPGYAVAHKYVAEQLLRSASDQEKSLSLAEKHLNQLLARDANEADAHAMLARICAQRKQWPQAIPHIDKAAGGADDLALQAAEALATSGHIADATAMARRAIDYYALQIKADPSKVQTRLKAAQANLMLREFAKTLDILEAGWRDTKDEAFRRAIAEVTAIWIKNVGDGMTPSRRLDLLASGLLWDPKSTSLLGLLFERSTLDASTSISPTSLPSRIGVVVATCKSIDACRLKRRPEAVAQLESALAIGDATALDMASNAACLWAYGSEPDLPSASLLADCLMSLRPAAPMAHRAKGLVLAKQQAWDGASEHMEAALVGLPADTLLHETLAKAYLALGRTAEAEVQQKLATTAPTTKPAAPATMKSGK